MPKKPSSSWWQSTTERIRKENPGYSDRQVDETAGHIWYHNMSQNQRKEETKKREGKLRVEAQEDLHVPGKGASPIKEVSVICTDSGAKALVDLITHIKDIGNPGHSFGIVVDDENSDTRKSFGWDGDGSDGISKIEVKEVEPQEKKTAQAESFMFPNLFSSEAKKWLEIQTKLEAVKILGGIVSTPEQALKAIDQAIDNISKQLAMAVEPEVKRIMDTQKDKIMDEIVVDTEQNVQQPAPPIPPNAPPAPAPAAQPVPQPAAAPVEPVEAAASTYMPARLRAAFDLAAKATGEVRHGEWIVCGLNDGSNEGIPAEFVEKEVLEETVKTAASGAGFNLSGSVLGDYTGLSKVASIEVRSGYGVRLKSSEDTSPWIVFDKEADAQEFLEDLDVEERPDEEDAFINTRFSDYEISFGGKSVGTSPDLDGAISIIKEEMEKTNYFPSVWLVSDHGNAQQVNVWASKK